MRQTYINTISTIFTILLAKTYYKTERLETLYKIMLRCTHIRWHRISQTFQECNLQNTN